MISIIGTRAFGIRHRFGQYIDVENIWCCFTLSKRNSIYISSFFFISRSIDCLETVNSEQKYSATGIKKNRSLWYVLKYVVLLEHVSDLDAITEARTNWKRHKFHRDDTLKCENNKGNHLSNFARKTLEHHEWGRARWKCLVSFNQVHGKQI